jgi:succinoglycan biosynthesis transport protein ExoP
MSRSKKNEGAIQKAGEMPIVQTAQGPAMIQIIDVPGGGALGPVLPYSGAGASKPAGLNVIGAVMRRWWLVLLVAVLIGGAGIAIADRLVKPTYECSSFVLYHSIVPMRGENSVATDPQDIIRTQIELLTKPEIALKAAHNPDLQQALPWLRGLNLEDPAVQKEVVKRLKNICDAQPVKFTELVEIHTEKADGFTAAAVVNAFADAFVQHCSDALLGRDAVRRRQMQDRFDQQDAMLKVLQQKRAELMVNNDFEVQAGQRQAIINQINEYVKLKGEADTRYMAAMTELQKYTKVQNDERALSAVLQLERKKKIEEEKAKDPMLQAAIAEQVIAFNAYQDQLAQGKTEHHREVIMAKERVRRAEQQINEFENKIAAAIDAKVANEQKLMIAGNLEQAQQKLNEAKQQVATYESRMAAMDTEARRLAAQKQVLDRIDDDISRVKKQVDDLWKNLATIKDESGTQGDAVIMVAERAEVPQTPTDDKRVKVQAASVIGGLFLGIFLALLVDKFDKRLRHPREIEGLLGAPMLGMIPRIQELKRAKGEMARNLIAEEFRIIRTQLLFGNPDAKHKTLIVTSPAPGDGKTSLAVNLAISMAKAGRRVLLIDADLRKPDVHRIFNIPEAPGFSDLVQGTADPASAIRKTDIESLDVLSAGTPAARPCELLSRPQLAALIESLAGMYDHIVFDTAPLLPVSDTHVLLSQVDGVICSFNADVDSDTVRTMEEILRKGRANVIGSVMNQVRYKQSTSYHRGKSAYSSYYNSPRTDKSVAALPKEGSAKALAIEEE